MERWTTEQIANNMKDELKKSDNSGNATATGTNIKVTYKGYEAVINASTGEYTKFERKAGSSIIEDIYAPYDTPYIPTNFSHIGTEDWNHGFTIKGNSGTSNENDEFVWVPCVLDQTKVKPGDTVQTFTKITTGKYNTNNLELHPSGGTNENVDPEDTTVAEIRTSVGTYGGFYIAKYEAGITGTTDNNSLSTQTVTDGSEKPLSQAGVGVWNSISRTNCLIVSKAMIPASTGAKSTLISGECWDTTLAWITETADSSYAEDSAGKGYYSDVASLTSYKPHTTGYYGTNTNNIFDMGGNVYEATSENCLYSNHQEIVGRGGFCWYPGSSIPASVRADSTDIGGVNWGFRVVLYK